MDETKPKKMVGRNVAIALGIICLVLLAGLVGGLGYFTQVINDKNNTISSLNSQISQLHSNITDLQTQIEGYNNTINSITTNFEDQLGLIGYWELFEEIPTGPVTIDSFGNGNALDKSGDGNTGTVYAATWVDYGDGYALNFDGAHTYISIPSFTLPNVTSLTVAAWIDGSPLTHIGYIFYNGENGEFVLHMGQRPDAGDDNPGLASFSVNFPDIGWIDVYSNSTLSPNNPHFIVGVWTMGVSIKIYVDRVLVGENDSIPNESLYNPGPAYIATIGRYYMQGALSTYFQGGIDEIRLYNRALSDSEIGNLYFDIP